MIFKDNEKISVVVPIYNEVENVEKLHSKILSSLKNISKDFEIIFVDDCSSDGTLAVCNNLSPLITIVLRGNHGQTAAMDAGIKASTGKYIITMDGDLQNDPADIHKMINYLKDNNFDVVSGWRKKRQDNFSKKFISRGAHFLRQIIIKDGIHDSGCSLKVYKKKCFETVDLYGEMHRFIPALLKIKGFKIGEIEVSHYPRKYGVSKYNWKRTIKGLLDMFAVAFWKKYVNRPIHLLGGVGILFWFIGFCLFGFLFVNKFFYQIDLSNNALTYMALFFFFFGFNFLFLGVLFDVVVRIYYANSRDKSYLIKKVIKK